jgi:hypothetical protein
MHLFMLNINSWTCL